VRSEVEDDLKSIEKLTLERWDLVEGYLSGDKDAIEWKGGQDIAPHELYEYSVAQ
jgi:hypothetical protein